MGVEGPDGERARRLFHAARDGDEDAWASLVAHFASRVHAVARAYRLAPADAEDVFQVTFLRLVANLDSIREPERLGAWLVTTSTREALKLLRRSSRVAPTAEGWEESLVDPGPEVGSGLLVAERDGEVWRALHRLSAPCQQLLRMLAADPGPSYKEVSLALSMPMGSIGPTRQRCLAQLRAEISRINAAASGSSTQGEEK